MQSHLGAFSMHDDLLNSSVAGDMSPPVQELPSAYKFTARDCHGRRHPRNDKWVCLVCHCEALAPWQSRAGTTACAQTYLSELSAACAVGGDISPPYRVRINLFSCTVCRLRGGTIESSCPTSVDRTLAVEADDSVRPISERRA